MPRSLVPLPAVAVLAQGGDEVRHIGEGDSQPWQPGLLPGSSIQDADLDTAAGSGMPQPSRPPAASSQFVPMRGAVLAPISEIFTVSHPGTGGAEDMRVLPTSTYATRGRFSLRGELFHCFVSYRVVTEGMDAAPELVALSSLEGPHCTPRTP